MSADTAEWGHEEPTMSDREYEPNPEDERIEVLDDDAEPAAPPTVDPDERIEESDDLDPEAPADA
jgi:hypothetical protein